MIHVLAVALGGAAGAVLRFGAMQATVRLFGAGFPYGTLMVNIVGSLAMGLLYQWLTARGLNDAWRGFVLVGLLGALTTFSTFSMDVVLMQQRGEAALAVLYVALSVALSVGAAFAGIWLARQAFQGAGA